MEYFYPRSPRGERLRVFKWDGCGGLFLSTLPARGATTFFWAMYLAGRRFLSTLPARGATQAAEMSTCDGLNFYPRFPRGERPLKAGVRWWQVDISIHAPREGSDPNKYRETEGIKISIHAPREGSDDAPIAGLRLYIQFLSTLPARGATRCFGGSIWLKYRFLSTLPARGAT